MDSKNYQVIIYPDHCDDEPGVIARRLAGLSGQPESAFLQEFSMDFLIFQRDLSYEEAIQYKKALASKGIPSQVRRAANEILEKHLPEPSGNKIESRIQNEADLLLTETKAEHKLHPKKQSAGGWDALFPDLAESVEKPPVVATKIPGSQPRSKAENGPAISSWQPALDTHDGVVASVPVATRQTPGVERVEIIPVANAKKAEKIESADKIAEIKKSRVFAGAVLTEAVTGSEQSRGAYAPVGFDPRPAHVPVLAAIFSGIAPGAGQIYNGQDDAALKYGMSFWWIRPWIASVRQAYEYGGRVRDYHEPRPDEASLGRALRYTAGWYLVVGVLVGLFVVGAGAIWESKKKQSQVAMPVELAEVVERAVQDLQFARMSANTAVNRFLDEQNKLKKEFTMSAEERAHRLYVIGYRYCEAGQYNLCEATMRRVTSLGVRNRDAYRLQAWASLQLKDGGRSPMPEIAEVPTLFELELHQENDPDRDIVQPALELMLNEQSADDTTNEVNELDEVDEVDEVDEAR